MSRHIDVSVVVLTWNSARYIVRCIDALSCGLSGLDFEILVIDNGSTDQTPQLLQKLAQGLPERLFVYPLSRNFGTTVPRNIGLKKARGEFLCVIDSDVEVTPSVFAELKRKLLADPSIGLAVPRILYPGGMVQKSYDRFPTLSHKVNRFFRLRAMEARQGKELAELTEPRAVDYAISAFWLFPRRLLETVGFLDENIFYSPEDVDYCLRIWKANYRIVYVPSASVVHHTQEISRGWRLNRAKLSHLSGLFYLFRKHRYFFRPPVFQGTC